jgi:hypothetical protein
VQACEIIPCHPHRFKLKQPYITGALASLCSDIKGWSAKCPKQDRRFPFVIMKEKNDGRPLIRNQICREFRLAQMLDIAA